MNRLLKAGVLVTATTTLMLSLAADARMYRYTDENGRTVISSTVPSAASTGGYEILSDNGRVIETVDAAPTQEELAERARSEKARAEKAAQIEKDTKLLRRFSNPDSAVRAMHRKLQEMHSLTRLKQSNIAVLINQLDAEQSRAADLERSGRDIPEATLIKMERLQSRIREIEREITSQNQEIEDLRESFIEDIHRLEEISGEERTLSLDPSLTENAGNL
jgi:chromosome segregation ATPase